MNKAFETSAVLSPREQEIYNMLIDGKTPKEISYDLRISYNTVVSHQKSIYGKLGVQSINELLIKSRDAENTRSKKSALNKILFAAAFIAFAAVLAITFLVIAPWKNSHYSETDKIIKNNKRIMLKTQLDYDLFLSRLFETAAEPDEWYICMGEGDWSFAWFSRKFSEEKMSDHINRKISRISVKHLNPEIAEKLEREGFISTGFSKRVLGNVEGFRQLCEAYNIGFNVSYYEEDGLPAWHGHSYRNWVLRGKWAPLGSGIVGVQTSLEAIPAADNDFSGMKKYFTGGFKKTVENIVK